VSAGDLARAKEIPERPPEPANAADGEGVTALHLAAPQGQREMMRALVAAGGGINRRDGQFGAAPSNWAIEYLREMGGLPAVAGGRDKPGKALLRDAGESGNEIIVALFRRALPAI